MTSNQIQDRFDEIKRHLETREYNSCVADCGRLFELAMRELVRELKQECKKASHQKEIIAAERAVAGKSTDKTFHAFGLGELIAFYFKGDIFTHLQELKTSNLHYTKQIDWKRVSRLRNLAIHGANKPGQVISDMDAMQMVSWLKAFLLETELISGLEPPYPDPPPGPNLSRCPKCNMPMESGWKYCPGCGATARNICPNCQREINPDWKICPFCETRNCTDVPGVTLTAAKNEYHNMCRGVYIDNIVSARERLMLDKLRLELGLTSDEAAELERSCAPPEIIDYQAAVEAACLDGTIDDIERNFLDRKRSLLKLDPDLAAEIEEQCMKLRQLRRPVEREKAQ